MRLLDPKNCNVGIFWWKGGGSHYPNPQKIKFRRRRRRMIMILFTCPWWRQQAQCQELPDGGFFCCFSYNYVEHTMNMHHLAADAVGRVGWASMFCHSGAHCQVSVDSVNKLEGRTKMPNTTNKNSLLGPEAFFSSKPWSPRNDSIKHDKHRQRKPEEERDDREEVDLAVGHHGINHGLTTDCGAKSQWFCSGWKTLVQVGSTSVVQVGVSGSAL